MSHCQRSYSLLYACLICESCEFCVTKSRTVQYILYNKVSNTTFVSLLHTHDTIVMS